LSDTLAVKISEGVFHLDISFICWFRVIRVLVYVFWSFRVGEGVMKYQNGCLQTPMEACFIDKAFFW